MRYQFISRERLQKKLGTSRASLGSLSEASRLYNPSRLMDRGYAKFALLNNIVASKNSYVCRVRDNSKYDVSALLSCIRRRAVTI